MKKLVSLLLVLVLAFSVAMPAMADSKDVYIDPLLVNFFEQSVSEWYAEDASRVLFVTCVLMDIYMGDNTALQELAVEAIAANKTYIAKGADGKTLTVMFFASSTCLTVIYSPTLQTYSAFTTDMSSSSASYVMSRAKEDGLYASYYNISGNDVLTMLEVLMDVIGS